MNFLSICQRLRQEAGASGTGPAAVTGQSGEMQRIVDWAQQAWVEIQNLHPDWRWMRKAATVNTVANTGSYVYTDFTDVATAATIVASTFSHWLTTDSQKLWTSYLQSGGQAGEVNLIRLDFDTWRFLYDRGSGASTQAKPIYFTVAPDNTIKLGPKPDGVYVVRGWYQQAATQLAANASIPALPSQYHMLIVWGGLMHYGLYEGAPDAYTRGKNNYDLMLSQLELNQLPSISLGNPLA